RRPAHAPHGQARPGRPARPRRRARRTLRPSPRPRRVTVTPAVENSTGRVTVTRTRLPSLRPPSRHCDARGRDLHPAGHCDAVDRGGWRAGTVVATVGDQISGGGGYLPDGSTDRPDA